MINPNVSVITYVKLERIRYCVLAGLGRFGPMGDLRASDIGEFGAGLCLCGGPSWGLGRWEAA